jgi:mono/diheme cytochrome c family protein
MPAALDLLWALLLIGVGVFVGGILLRRVPAPFLVVGTVLVVFGLGIPALVIDDNRSETAAGSGAESGEAAGGGGSTEAAAPEGGGGGGEKAAAGGGSEEGKLIFTQSCGTCHTLADAGTSGQVGPPLDEVKPDSKRVLNAIKKGGTGSGTMPANIVSGKEAQQVADYVAEVAGK